MAITGEFERPEVGAEQPDPMPSSSALMLAMIGVLKTINLPQELRPWRASISRALETTPNTARPTSWPVQARDRLDMMSRVPGAGDVIRQGRESMYSTVEVKVKIEMNPELRAAIASAYPACEDASASDEEIGRWVHRVVHEAVGAVFQTAMSGEAVWGDDDPPGSRYDLYPKEMEEADRAE